MKMYIPFFIIYLITYSCVPATLSREKTGKCFEGVITYSIKYTELSKDFPQESLKKLDELTGSKMVLTFKNGNYRKQYFTPTGKIISERYLNLSEGKSYHRPDNTDIIYWVDITKNDSKTKFKQIKDSTIINEPVIGIQTESIVLFADKSMKINGEHYYSKNLRVNPNWYTNYKESNFDEIIKIGRGMQLLYYNKGPYWNQIITAVSVNHRAVKENEITIVLDEKSTLKKL